MLKIKDNVNLEELERFGFHSFKVNRLQTNYYRAFSRYRDCNLLLINNINREIMVDKVFDNDTRIHKVPKLHYKDRTMIEEVLFDLVSAGLVEKVVD